MFHTPIYAQDIVVGIVFRSTFAWYVTDKDYWYLDYTKYHQGLLSSGYKGPVVEDYSARFGIAILNKRTAEYFLTKIEDRRVPAQELTKMMLMQRHLYEEFNLLDSQEYWDEILDFSPCLLVDFDNETFSSQYPEMIRFEAYVPDGWKGTYRAFLSDIPERERYWIVDGKNLFNRKQT